jgi:phosphohistidine phosphatase SixA
MTILDPAVTLRRRLLKSGLFALLLGPHLASNAGPDDDLWDALQHGGLVILLRHGLTTPGVGDPPNFKLGDCSTQRNLTDEGRAQAAKLGEAFRARNIPIERVLSSPWCRCIETARLAFDGAPETTPALANLFGHPENRDKQVADLRKLLSDFRGRGNLVLVSHGSTIVAVTDVSPDPAEMVVVRPEGSGKFSVLGRLSAR